MAPDAGVCTCSQHSARLCSRHYWQAGQSAAPSPKASTREDLNMSEGAFELFRKAGHSTALRPRAALGRKRCRKGPADEPAGKRALGQEFRAVGLIDKQVFLAQRECGVSISRQGDKDRFWSGSRIQFCLCAFSTLAAVVQNWPYVRSCTWSVITSRKKIKL